MQHIKLRDLNGIAEIERQYRLYLDKRLAADEIGDLARVVDDKSTELFGISYRDTGYWGRWPEAAAATPEEWERHFAFIEDCYKEEDQFWAFFGIDVTDGEGAQLACMDSFGRPLVCALKRLHPNAAVIFRDGEADTDFIAAAEAWGRRLLRGDKP